MKQYFNRVLLALGLVIGVSAVASAQVIVKVRPAAPVVVRPAAPSPRHIWVDGGWEVRSGRYVHVDGHWVAPRPGYRWTAGYWATRRGGYVWVPGRWARV